MNPTLIDHANGHHTGRDRSCWRCTIRAWLRRTPPPATPESADLKEKPELTPPCTEELHAKYGGACFHCCDKCNYDTHRCHFCGTELTHDSFEDRARTKRHWLSDCRPDLLPEFTDGPMA